MTHKTQPTAHAEITAPISADLRRIEQSAARAADRDTHFYLAGWNGARGNEDSHEHFRRALQAAPPSPAAVAVPADLAKRIKDCAAHWAYMERIDHGDQAEVEQQRLAELVDQLAATPAQEHATQLADQGQAYSIDADPEGTRARVAEAITSALASGVKKSDRPSDEHWLRPFWMHAYFAVVQHNALRDSAEAMLNAPGALTQAARDVLAERARQVDAEGFNHARDDEYVGRQLAGAAASYLILAAGGREEDARAVWPWRKEWLKPSDQRRYLEKACALALAEMERLDRATARAAKGDA